MTCLCLAFHSVFPDNKGAILKVRSISTPVLSSAGPSIVYTSTKLPLLSPVFHFPLQILTQSLCMDELGLLWKARSKQSVTEMETKQNVVRRGRG